MCYLKEFNRKLFVGFVSPMISQGLATMREFELIPPQLRRRNLTESSTTETSRMFQFLQDAEAEFNRVRVGSNKIDFFSKLDLR